MYMAPAEDEACYMVSTCAKALTNTTTSSYSLFPISCELQYVTPTYPTRMNNQHYQPSPLYSAVCMQQHQADNQLVRKTLSLNQKQREWELPSWLQEAF